MRENCTSGSVRGVPGDGHSYRKCPWQFACPKIYPRVLLRRLFDVFLSGYAALTPTYGSLNLAGSFPDLRRTVPDLREGFPSLPKGSPCRRKGFSIFWKGLPNLRKDFRGFRRAFPISRKYSSNLQKACPDLRRGFPDLRKGCFDSIGVPRSFGKLPRNLGKVFRVVGKPPKTSGNLSRTIGKIARGFGDVSCTFEGVSQNPGDSSTMVGSGISFSLFSLYLSGSLFICSNCLRCFSLN
uniref:Uncharacterized protein n=1 Tax=Candidatus Kentrum sp. LFY TaxID=2126342 RepID=A0A450U602_9GAMM|nr:MAG: hypothetical protein BECKLFY1418B_GA0070995_100493 [Candidatus Kentron sp. LFY]